MHKKDVHKLTPAPPMGWNSFDCYGVAANERLLLENLEVMVDKFKLYGYEYFVLDAGWYAEYEIEPGKIFPSVRRVGKRIIKHTTPDNVHIDEYGRYLPSKCNFPNGLQHIIDKVHKYGLKFGIHIMRGIPRKAVKLKLPVLGTNYTAADIADVNDICPWCPYNYGVDMDKDGAQEYYNSVVNLLASWGVDFIKLDDVVSHPKEIEAFAEAIRQCDRDIVLSLSPGGPTDINYMRSYLKANMLRITPDIWDNKKSLDIAFDAWYKYSEYNKKNAVPAGFWFDLDMIPFGRLCVWNPKPEDEEENPEIDKISAEMAGKGYERMSMLNDDQKYTFITMRAMAASPLFIGGELTTLDEFSYRLLTNKEMIRCNQNGKMGSRVYKENGVEVWHTLMKNCEGEGWIGIFNRSENNLHVRLKKEDLGLQAGESYRLYSVWEEKEVAFAGDYLETNVNADGVVFLKYKKAGERK